MEDYKIHVLETIIGREEEKKILTAALESGEAELIAIYGRRRIGKTFLVRNHYDRNIVFELTGVHEAGFRDQLLNFSLAMQAMMDIPVRPAVPENWILAFSQLNEHLKKTRQKKPIVLVFDEFPWLATPRSGFLQAFGHWWNTAASRNPLIKVVICGSAASWIIRNVINDRGGLHNRVTRRIRLLPFSLKETSLFLQHKGVRLDQYQLLQLYMAMGGVPQYLKQVYRGESATQAIDRLFFTRTGLLMTEFGDLFKSLFASSQNHEAVVMALSKKASGMNRAEIIEACGFTSGGWTTELFNELEESGFITQSIPFGKTMRDSIYKLSDEYSLFYMKFVANARATGAGTWVRESKTPSYNSWSGFAFEAVCQKHTGPIKKALGISGVYTEISAWRYIPKEAGVGAQIDLLLDRADHCINLCEIKFSTKEVVINKKYAAELDNKMSVFQEQSKTRKTIFPTMITTYGTKKNDHYTGRIQGEVVMSDLFE